MLAAFSSLFSIAIPLCSTRWYIESFKKQLHRNRWKSWKTHIFNVKSCFNKICLSVYPNIYTHSQNRELLWVSLGCQVEVHRLVWKCPTFAMFSLSHPSLSLIVIPDSMFNPCLLTLCLHPVPFLSPSCSRQSKVSRPSLRGVIAPEARGSRFPRLLYCVPVTSPPFLIPLTLIIPLRNVEGGGGGRRFRDLGFFLPSVIFCLNAGGHDGRTDRLILTREHNTLSFGT